MPCRGAKSRPGANLLPTKRRYRSAPARMSGPVSPSARERWAPLAWLPALLDALELTQNIEGEQSACLRALQMFKELNATGRRKLPEDAPTDFLSQRLKPIRVQPLDDDLAWELGFRSKLLFDFAALGTA